MGLGLPCWGYDPISMKQTTHHKQKTAAAAAAAAATTTTTTTTTTKTKQRQRQRTPRQRRPRQLQKHLRNIRNKETKKETNKHGTGAVG